MICFHCFLEMPWSLTSYCHNFAPHVTSRCMLLLLRRRCQPSQSAMTVTISLRCGKANLPRLRGRTQVATRPSLELSHSKHQQQGLPKVMLMLDVMFCLQFLYNTARTSGNACPYILHIETRLVIHCRGTVPCTTLRMRIAAIHVVL